MNVVERLCAFELENIHRSLQGGDTTSANQAVERLHVIRETAREIVGGATFWQEFQMQTGKQLKDASKSEIVAYLESHEPSSAQFNGALQELKNHLIKLESLSVAQASNEAAKLLNIDPEFLLQKRERKRQALKALLDSVPPQIVDLTLQTAMPMPMPSFPQTQTQEIIDLTNDTEETLTETAGEEDRQSLRTQQLWASAALFISILVDSTDANIKFFALTVLLLINMILNKNFEEAAAFMSSMQRQRKRQISSSKTFDFLGN